jgi:PAS domain S-box-containing protein
MQAQRDHQRRWAIEKKVGVGFGFALALLLILGLVSYQTTLKLNQTERDETPVDLALDKLDEISSQLKDAESSVHGYLITGDEQYTQPYHGLTQTIDRDLDDLRALSANNPVFRQKIDNVAPLIATEEATMAQLYDLHQQAEMQPIAQAALVNQSQRSMEKILQLIGELEDEENQLLQQKTDEMTAKDQAVNLSITFGSFLAILLAALMINRDIVERKRADYALRESAARFRRLAENALDMIYRYRILPTPGFEYVSPAAMAITGYDPEEFYAEPDLGYKLVHPEDQGLIDSPRHPSDTTVPLTVRWLHKDGTVIWTNQQRVPIYDPEGNLVAIEGIVRDVSERMQAYLTLEWRVEERTHEIERRRQVAEGLRDILTILNSNRPLDEILDSILAQACRLLGTDAGVV